MAIDEPMLTHHSRPKAMVYIRVHSWYCTSYGFEQLYNDIYITVVSYRVFLLPSKSFVFLRFIPSSPQPLATLMILLSPQFCLF